jgi:hypothetical protein|tara:strand:+ start:3412 stop:3735 length:324 start_codon:yes stop_codon:yes gene_type:complete
MSFQKNVIIITFILLVLTLLAFGIALYGRKYNQEFPPIVADCPDYWVDMDGVCLNVKNLGKDSCSNRMDFNNDAWTGADGKCLKNKWAKACDLTWDGITNNNDLCKS